MSIRQISALLLMGVTLTPVIAVNVASGQVPQVLGRAYLSFSPDRQEQHRQVQPGELFTFYLVLELDLARGVELEGGCCEGALEFAPSMYLNVIDWKGANLVLGDGLTTGSYDFITCWYPSVMMHGGANVFGSFTGLILEDTPEVLVTIHKQAWCRTVGCDPLRWLVRNPPTPDHPESRIYQALVDAETSPLSVTAASVADGQSTWGSIKALYDGD